MTAYVLIRGRPEDRVTAMQEGLRALGYQVAVDYGDQPIERSDVLVIWNRYGGWGELADRFDAAGARVIVCENGYVGQTVAMSLDYHNGRGRHPIGDGSRWDAMGVQVQPWRGGGRHILVCGQRGIGYGGIGHAEDWASGVIHRLSGTTSRPILFRPHPKGQRRPRYPNAESVDCRAPLAEHLADCWAIVVWTSNAATAALIAGVPVFYEGPALITGKAALKGIDLIATPLRGDRRQAFIDLSWGQWSAEEIAAGAPFRRLLADPGDQVWSSGPR
jgi:hypothetical protein